MADKPRNKLQEQATAKADLSYSYWASNQANKSHAPPPKRLSAADLQSQHELDDQNKATGASVWNKAGTFEEKSASSWCKARFKELVVGRVCGSVQVTDVKHITGEANIFIVRGKRRCGYELEIDLQWRAEVPGTSGREDEVTGTTRLREVCSDDLGDMEMAVDVDKKELPYADVARKSALQMRPIFEEVLRQLLEELKAK